MQKFIPIYGDHLLNPLLTPANYESEVYHVNKNGEEAGVVYSEIQDNENDLDNLVQLGHLFTYFFRLTTSGNISRFLIIHPCALTPAVE